MIAPEEILHFNANNGANDIYNWSHVYGFWYPDAAGVYGAVLYRPKFRYFVNPERARGWNGVTY